MIKLNKPGPCSFLMLQDKLGKVVKAAFATSVLFVAILKSAVGTGGQLPEFLSDSNFNIDGNGFFLPTDYDQIVTNQGGTCTKGSENQNNTPLGNVGNDNFNNQHELYFNDRAEQGILKSPVHLEDGDVGARDHLNSNKEQQNFEFWDFDKNPFLNPLDASLEVETTSSVFNIDNVRENASREELNFDKNQKEDGSSLFDNFFDTMFINHAIPTLDNDSEKVKQRYSQYLEDHQQGTLLFNLNPHPKDISENSENNTNVEKIISSNVSSKQVKRKLDLESSKVTRNKALPVSLKSPNPQLEINSATLQMDLIKNFFNWSQKFTKVGSTFERVVVSRIAHSRQYSTDDELILTINQSPGIMITGNEFFASRRIDCNEGLLSKILETDHLDELIKKTNERNFEGSDKVSLENAMKETTERYEFLCRNNMMPAIWIKYHENGTIFYANRLESLYKVYVLHNGEFTELDDPNKTLGAHKSSPGSNFILIINNFAATNVVNTPFKLQSDDAEEIYNYLHEKFKIVTEAFRLIVIKLKENSMSTNHQINRSRPVIDLVSDEPAKDIIPGNFSLELLNNGIFVTKRPPFILELLNSQTGIAMGNRPFCSGFLTDEASDFVEIMTSRIGYGEINATSKSLMFLGKGSHGVVFSRAGFLVSYLVKRNSWPIPEILNKTCPTEVISQMKKNLLEDTSLILASRITENHGMVFKTLSYDNKAPIIWAQLLKNNDIVYANSLENLYQIYVLDDGKFVKLDDAKDKVKIYKASSKITFMLMASSFIASMIDLVPEFRGNNTTQLYMFLWNKIIQRQGQISESEPELMIIKMRENLNLERRSFFQFDSGN